MGVYQIGEVIKRIREGLGITQEELSDGICAVETLSRIECGKRTPSRANVKALMERLGRSGEMYLPFLHSTDMDVYMMENQISKLLSSHRSEEAEALLLELEKKIDTNDNVNMQYVVWIHAVIGLEKGTLSAEEILSRFETAIRYTIPAYQEGYLPHTIFTRHELTILCDIAILMKMNGKVEEAIGMLQQMKYYFDSTRIGVEERNVTEVLVLFNLGKMLGQEGKRESSLELDERTRDMCLAGGKGGFLPSILYNIGFEKEALGHDRAECIEIMREAYYISELMKNERQRVHIKKHADERYGDIF